MLCSPCHYIFDNKSKKIWKTRKKSLSGITSHYYGVGYFKRDKKWQATIRINHKQKHIGYFSEERHAAMAYDIWAKDLFGEFARLNFTAAQ